MGNWDLAGVTLDIFGLPIFSIARQQKNRLTDAFLNKKRRNFGLDVLFNDSSSLKKIIQRINSGEIFIILPDVRNPRVAHEIPFLKGKANIGVGAAAFAKSCNCPIIPFVVRRNGWFNHEAKLHAPIYPNESLNKNDDVEIMMTKLMSIFNAEIDASPEQYFWYNKRWILDPISNQK